MSSEKFAQAATDVPKTYAGLSDKMLNSVPDVDPQIYKSDDLDYVVFTAANGDKFTLRNQYAGSVWVEKRVMGKIEGEPFILETHAAAIFQDFTQWVKTHMKPEATPEAPAP